jgi:hypothetical protein
MEDTGKSLCDIQKAVRIVQPAGIAPLGRNDANGKIIDYCQEMQIVSCRLIPLDSRLRGR